MLLLFRGLSAKLFSAYALGFLVNSLSQVPETRAMSTVGVALYQNGFKYMLKYGYLRLLARVMNIRIFFLSLSKPGPILVTRHIAARTAIE